MVAISVTGFPGTESAFVTVGFTFGHAAKIRKNILKSLNLCFTNHRKILG